MKTPARTVRLDVPEAKAVGDVVVGPEAVAVGADDPGEGVALLGAGRVDVAVAKGKVALLVLGVVLGRGHAGDGGLHNGGGSLDHGGGDGSCDGSCLNHGGDDSGLDHGGGNVGGLDNGGGLHHRCSNVGGDGGDDGGGDVGAAKGVAVVAGVGAGGVQPVGQVDTGLGGGGQKKDLWAKTKTFGVQSSLKRVSLYRAGHLRYFFIFLNGKK